MKFLEAFKMNGNELNLVGIPIGGVNKIGSIEIEGHSVRSYIRFNNEVYYSLVDVPDLIANINKGIYDSESREILGQKWINENNNSNL